jgi:hypothetical protein
MCEEINDLVLIRSQLLLKVGTIVSGQRWEEFFDHFDDFNSRLLQEKDGCERLNY